MYGGRCKLKVDHVYAFFWAERSSFLLLCYYARCFTIVLV